MLVLKKLLVGTISFIIELLGLAAVLMAYAFAGVCFIVQALQNKKRRNEK